MSNQYYCFGTRTTFIQAAPKIFCRVNGALISWRSYWLKNDQRQLIIKPGSVTREPGESRVSQLKHVGLLGKK